MKDKNHLPIYGVGPVYGCVIIALTAAAALLGRREPFKKGLIEMLKIPFLIIGILLIICGIILWCGAVFRSKIDDGITENKLVTSGVYSLCRNPLYTAFMLACTGALFISGNVFFLPLFFVYWIFMTVLMKNTEEKWLGKLYGKEYHDYCRRVNRCIPFPKNNGK
ncbi:MAG: isoprenylcysteine carboxylmethyltransferase family protein [Lachnospiraceae bacterium]|nr:isoprenylcysteine carboxylmethyltransferase family protein [Ruminococcus sp.]MCM1275683.1 isoprenylcysteine carboxylmethyltransferase family protein [Lachnospiraceae bacterium]